MNNDEKIVDLRKGESFREVLRRIAAIPGGIYLQEASITFNFPPRPHLVFDADSLDIMQGVGEEFREEAEKFQLLHEEVAFDFSRLIKNEPILIDS